MVDPTPVKRRLRLRNFSEISHRHRTWSVHLEDDEAFESALDPSFYTDISEKIMGHDKANPKGRGDKIEVRKLSTGLYAELIITEIGPGFVRVMPIKAFEPKEDALPEDAPLKPRWNVGKQMHEVIRKADGVVMQGGFQTRESAMKWIADHMVKMAA